MTDRTRRFLADAAAGGASGVLFALSFDPPNLWPLVFVALVPMLSRVLAAEGRGAGRTFFFFGLSSYWIGLRWLHTVIGVIGPGLLAVLLALLFFWPTGRAFAFLARRRVPIALAAAAVFLLSEWIRTWLFTGFPWLFLSHPLAERTLLVQIADVFGAWGLTALVAATNGAFAAAARRLRAGRPWGRALLPLAAPAALAAAFLLYGAARLPSLAARDGPVVLLVQGNVPQGEKRLQFGEGGVAERILDRHLDLTRRGLAAHPEVDVVVWPETMYPYVIRDADSISEAPPRPLRRVLAAVAGRHAVIGALARTGPENEELRNSAFLVTPDGRIPARYDKLKAVPGGEFIPLRTIAPQSLLDFVGAAIERSAGFVPNLVEGDDLSLFPAAGAKFAPLICYETTYPGLSRDAVIAGADVLLNISNYGWFPETSEPEQALAMSILRAVETRRPLVVAANTGISGVVDAAGRVERLVVDGRDEDVAGFYAGRVPLCDAGSLYVAVGDVLPIAAGIFLFGVAVRALATRRGRAGREEAFCP